MTWADWLPAISTSGVLAVAAFIAGILYKAAIEKGIQHKLDTKLEELKAKLRQEEEALKANLRARDEQLEALRRGALSGMANRYAALDARKLTAVEAIWDAVVELGKLRLLARMTTSIKMEYAIDAAAKGDAEAEKLKKLAEFIWKMSGADNIKIKEAPDKERPFLSPLVWALFTAYRQVLAHPMAQIALMRTGTEARFLADAKEMLNLVKSALPHQSAYVDKYGTSVLPYLVEELEEKVLRELVANLEDTTVDEKSVKQAGDILKAAERVASSQQPQVDLPDLPGIVRSEPKPQDK